MQTNIISGVEERLQAFVKLGQCFVDFVRWNATEEQPTTGGMEWLIKMKSTVEQAELQNRWFTSENVLYALEGWGELLQENRLRAWLAHYTLTQIQPKTIAVITAGNIPLVGFHDVLCTLITGHKALIKCSSNDKVILPFVADFLQSQADQFRGKIEFSEGVLKDFDAVIATGSNNTARYFEYYFGKKPHIIRKNRNSVAVLTGHETKDELALLGEDVFRYFGLGCRSVSKLFVPRGYDFDSLLQSIYNYGALLEHNKFTNNYDYNKAVYLMSEFDILDNGFVMLKEDPRYASPIATLFYEYYDSPENLKQRLKQDENQIQCVVAREFVADEVPFGQTQRPDLNDYADRIDTVEFLLRNQ